MLPEWFVCLNVHSQAINLNMNSVMPNPVALLFIGHYRGVLVCGKASSPLYQVRYSGPEYVKFEVYCSTHIESIYENTKNKTNAEIAESYGNILGEIDRTPPNPWD